MAWMRMTLDDNNEVLTEGWYELPLMDNQNKDYIDRCYPDTKQREVRQQEAKEVARNLGIREV